MPPFQSWGRFPQVEQTEVPLFWTTDFPPRSGHGTVLPVGLGRSYGDACLNAGNTVCLTPLLKRFLDFDPNTGILACEAGVSLAEILEVFVPRGWFLPVTPGTKFVTVGGAIANDVHGKNHHVSGTFGRFVRRFELVRSNGECLLCSPDLNPDLFSATIGGLGLTGFISWAEIQLRPIVSRQITMQSIKFCGLPEFIELSREFAKHEYTVSWVDCVATGDNAARGIFMAGDHSTQPEELKSRPPRGIPVPFDFPGLALNHYSVSLFNTAYYHKQRQKRITTTIDYDPFFYPLDSVLHWNRIYGRLGMTQFQCCIPHEKGLTAATAILDAVARSGLASFLTVLKVCGDICSPGMMSFPRPGITIALDFPIKPGRTAPLIQRLNQMTLEAGGRIYPAKDAFMTAAQYRAFYPRLEEFKTFVDPGISSSFWRRVTAS